MHYFIDPQALPQQTAAEAYGPDPVDPTNKFNVTSRFQLAADAKTFACQDSMMIVQQSDADPTLVNIVLKPISEGLKFQRVAYYIYRGILKSSLINGTQIAAQDPQTNSDLITRIYNHNSQSQSLDASNIGFDNNTLSNINHIDFLFSTGSSVIPIRVFEGEWFANFKAGTIGFEVICEADKVIVDLGYCRKARSVIEITGPSGFQQDAKRQEILAFIDPAALYALNNEDDVFTSLISKFHTKDRLYIDIRGEKGYSYNFYGNYSDDNGDSLKILNTTQQYQTQGWPIIQIDRTINSSVNINLRIGDNLYPLIYVQNRAVKKSNPNSCFTRVYDSSNGWSNTISFGFPSASVYSYYIKAYYFHETLNPVAESPFIKNNRYYNAAFCPIDIPNLADINFNTRWVENPNFSFISEPLQINNTGNFGYVAHNGAVWDDNRILFYSTSFSQYRVSGKTFSPGDNRKLKINSTYYKNNLLNRLDIACKAYSKKVSENVYQNIKILTVNNFTADNNIQDTESGVFLGLTMSEIAVIKDEASTLVGSHHKYIFLEPTSASPLFNNGDITVKDGYFYEYRVRIQGLDTNGNLIQITPQITNSGNDVDILVYSRDKFFFASKFFTDSETETLTTNQVEMHIYPDGRIIPNQPIEPRHVGKKIAYIYHERESQHLVCELVLTQINKLANGQKKYKNKDGDLVPFTDVPSGWSRWEEGIDGEVAPHDYYYYTNGDIWVKSGNTIIYYKSLRQKSFMIKFHETLVNPVRIHGHLLRITLNSTRHYMDPLVTAAFLGAAIQCIQFHHYWNGSAYSNGTCFPSVEHASGQAFDMRYQQFDPNLLPRNMMRETSQALTSNKLMIDAFLRFKFTKILIGKNPRYTALVRPMVKPEFGHDNHIHISQLVQ